MQINATMRRGSGVSEGLEAVSHPLKARVPQR